MHRRPPRWICRWVALGLALHLGLGPLPAWAWLAGTLADGHRKGRFAEDVVGALSESDPEWKELERWKRRDRPDRRALREREMYYLRMRLLRLTKVLDRPALLRFRLHRAAPAARGTAGPGG